MTMLSTVSLLRLLLLCVISATTLSHNGDITIDGGNFEKPIIITTNFEPQQHHNTEKNIPMIRREKETKKKKKLSGFNEEKIDILDKLEKAIEEEIDEIDDENDDDDDVVGDDDNVNEEVKEMLDLYFDNKNEEDEIGGSNDGDEEEVDDEGGVDNNNNNIEYDVVKDKNIVNPTSSAAGDNNNNNSLEPASANEDNKNDSVESEEEEEEDKVIDSDLDLHFRLAPNLGIIKYVELNTAASSGAVDMKGVEFWSDAAKGHSSSGTTSNNGDTTRLDQSSFTQIDILLIPLDESSSRRQSACNLMDLGIGAATEEGEIRWCCTDEALERGLCSTSDYQGIIVDHSLRGRVIQRKVDVPLSENVAGKFDEFDSSSWNSGRHLLIFANCDTGGEDVYVSGKMTWEQQDDAMESLSLVQDMEETCCQELEGSTCGDEDYTWDFVSEFETALSPGSTAVHYAEVSMPSSDDDEENNNDLGKLAFWLNGQQQPKTTAKDKNNNNTTSHDATVVDVALFPLPSDSRTTTTTLSACDWVDLGVGAMSPHDGEVHLCCSDTAINLGLCEDSNLGRMIFNHSIYNGFQRSLVLSDNGAQSSSSSAQSSMKIIHEKDLEATEPGIYIAIFSNCDSNAKEIQVSGRLTETQNMIPYLSFTCDIKQGMGGDLALAIVMVGSVFLIVATALFKTTTSFCKKGHNQDYQVFTSNKTYPDIDLVLT